MSEPTVKQILNEAEDIGGNFDAINLDLYWNVESRPTEHVLEITAETPEETQIAEEHLYEAARNSDHWAIEEEEEENRYRLIGNEE